MRIGGVEAPDREDPRLEDFEDVDASPVRCLDPDASRAMVQEINRLRKANESLGGTFEVLAYGATPGLGSHVSWEERIDGQLAGALASIPSIKGVGIGHGFDLAGRPGSEAHDEIFWSQERGYFRETNRSGGIEGGMTTGEPLSVAVAQKPLPTLTKPLRSVRHRPQGARPGAARAHRLGDDTRRRGRRRGDGGVRARRRLPAQVRRRPHRRRARRGRRLRAAHRLAAPRHRVTAAMAPAAQRPIALIGFMGAGKSRAARALARAAGAEPLDADRLLEDELGASIETVFARDGEAAFRAAEERVVGDLLERRAGPVVALGGGSVMHARVRDALAAGYRVVLLDVDVDTAWERLHRRSAPARPLARDRTAFERLHAARAPLYEAAADAIVPATLDSVIEVLPALDALDGAPPATRLLWAHAASADYPVFVGRGLVAAGFASAGGDPDAGARSFAVTDTTVARLHPGGLAGAAHTIAIEPGEQHKTLVSAERIWRDLARAGMAHGDRLLALGGGVVGDLAGFCAATYQRGVPVRQIPTTLVAQVDSAYGGKTGIDLPEAKNYVGAYHQPEAVIVDTATLETLPDAELAAGYAEVVKTALIAGGELWERVRAGATHDDDTILACARTKLAVVAADERDGGRRQALNLGHTLGHAIESVTGYTRYRHGEAVALGLLAALTLSGQGALRDEVAELVQAQGLPTELDPAVDLDAVIAATARDKKVRAGRLGYVLVEAPGDVRVGCPVEPDAARAALAALRSGQHG